MTRQESRVERPDADRGTSCQGTRRPSRRLIASARVAADVRNWPRTALVTVIAPGLRTPRIDMHRCSASMTTMTPRGLRSSSSSVRDLGRQPLLHLRPAGEDVDEPGQLRQPGDLPGFVRDVADVRLPVEGDQVVLAEADEPDVAHQHHLVVALIEDRREDFGRVLVQPGERLLVAARHPPRGVTQALAVGVLPDRDQQLTDGRFSASLIEGPGAVTIGVVPRGHSAASGAGTSSCRWTTGPGGLSVRAGRPPRAGLSSAGLSVGSPLSP